MDTNAPTARKLTSVAAAREAGYVLKSKCLGATNSGRRLGDHYWFEGNGVSTSSSPRETRRAALASLNEVLRGSAA